MNENTRMNLPFFFIPALLLLLWFLFRFLLHGNYFINNRPETHSLRSTKKMSTTKILWICVFVDHTGGWIEDLCIILLLWCDILCWWLMWLMIFLFVCWSLDFGRGGGGGEIKRGCIVQNNLFSCMSCPCSSLYFAHQLTSIWHFFAGRSCYSTWRCRADTFRIHNVATFIGYMQCEIGDLYNRIAYNETINK